MPVDKPFEALPDGFVLSRGGLAIPADSVTLQTEHWTREEAKHLTRAYKVAKRRGLLFMIGCRDDRCADNPVIERVDLEEGGFLLRCQHLVRVVGTSAAAAFKPPRRRG